MHKGCLQKKNCWEGDIGPYRREGGKKIPFFSSSKRGHILMGGGVKNFLSHVPCSILCFCLLTICGSFWCLTLWKFSISHNKVVDLNLKQLNFFGLLEVRYTSISYSLQTQDIFSTLEIISSFGLIMELRGVTILEIPVVCM